MGVSDGIRIRDLLNPDKKMSKSTAADGSKIMLSDTPARAAKKIMSATTDSFGKIKYDMWSQPGISNLLVIEALTTDTPLETVIARWSGKTRYGELKKKVASSITQMLTDFQSKLVEIGDAQVYDLFEQGEKYASTVANAKLAEVEKALKLR